jgi:conjugative transfer region protein TrbK
MDGKMLARTIIVAILAGLLVTTIVMLRRDGGQGQTDGIVPSSLVSDDLSAELGRCGKLGPQDAAEDSRCQQVWEENRRRFFGYAPHPINVSPDRSAPTASRSNVLPSTVSPPGSASYSHNAGAPQP